MKRNIHTYSNFIEKHGKKLFGQKHAHRQTWVLKGASVVVKMLLSISETIIELKNLVVQ